MDILTEEELKEISDGITGMTIGVMWDKVDEIIASHRALLSANAELSFKNQKYKEVLDKLDAHMDFSVPWLRKQELSFSDPSGINQVFKEAYRIINPEQAAINEALEELK